MALCGIFQQELLDIQPRELRFTFVVKKQSSCSIQLSNTSDQYIAFKVKTTSPRKYCVRPNIGIVKPKATCGFTVTMQAQKVAPPDFQCKDKFLIQSTVVPFGTTGNDITSAVFSKESGKYIEENKLRVVLVSPPQSPVLLPNNGEFKKEQSYLTSSHNDIENIPPPQRIPFSMKFSEVKKFIESFNKQLGYVTELPYLLWQLVEDVPNFQASKSFEELKPAKNSESKPFGDAGELESPMDVDEPELVKDLEKLKLKLHSMESKLKQADITIARLSDERSTAIKESNMLKQELEVVRRKGMKRIQVGFPLLYVCMVALISLALGYLVHS